MFGNLWNKKEKPLPSWASFGGGVGGFLNAGAEAELEATGGLINEYSPSPTVHYRTHIFLASGALTIAAGKLKSFDYWVVAGGGGGGGGADDRGCRGGRGGGGFYYALDVTDPYSPTFLWQLSTNASGEPLFGSASGKPAIAIVNIQGVQEAVAILPGGYAEGVNRLLAARGNVLLRGRRFPFAGRISMDLTVVDIGAMPAAGVGDEAVSYTHLTLPTNREV